MPRKRIHADAAARTAAHRAKNDTVTLSVDLPRHLVESLDAFLRFKNVTKVEVISKLLISQLLRKR
ncbi:hypothetical protein [Rhodoferax ferrireducens]|uniref:hypothetical protein n=1 Tax=Rhodoferax ferrireducens TaxID=192843 RepID=UPI000E0D72CD|nr:hypothetical protein [Rhodoferax ferrireducens]